MAVKFSNNAVTTLSAGISAGATSFTVASASLFPTLASGDWTYVSLTSEVVKVTAISGTTFTCDATSTAHVSGESVELRMTAEILNDVALGDDESLDAISNASAITGNAVDVFIYDTSNDSDGGAWRKRTQATSWYNETLNTSTRGSRKEFPSVAVIVVHQLTSTGKVTIYDGDTPDLDMWMVLNGDTSATDLIPSYMNTSLSCVSALNGIVMVGNGTYDINSINFVEDSGYKWGGIYKYKYLGNIQQRSAGLGTGSNIGTGIVNRAVNDVAMTVLPNAPIDSTTGLPIPTIACLVGESLVTLSNGTNKRIDEVEIGEVVKTLEGEHTVTNWFDQGVKDVIELEFDGGQRLTCTADHRIRTTDGWVEAGNLTDSDEVVGL